MHCDSKRPGNLLSCLAFDHECQNFLFADSEMAQPAITLGFDGGGETTGLGDSRADARRSLICPHAPEQCYQLRHMLTAADEGCCADLGGG
jgi:hypothetical protein